MNSKELSKSSKEKNNRVWKYYLFYMFFYFKRNLKGFFSNKTLLDLDIETKERSC